MCRLSTLSNAQLFNQPFLVRLKANLIRARKELSLCIAIVPGINETDVALGVQGNMPIGTASNVRGADRAAKLGRPSRLPSHSVHVPCLCITHNSDKSSIEHTSVKHDCAPPPCRSSLGQ